MRRAGKLPLSAWLLPPLLPLGLLLAATRHAQADVPGLTLTWNAPPGCPERAELEETVAKLLGEKAGRRAVALDASVEVTMAGEGRWQALVVTHGASTGTRKLEGGSCASVALASAVVIAQAIQPGDEPEPPAGPEPPTPPRRPAPVERVVPFISAFGGAALGSLPGVAPELGLGLALGRGSWLGELRFSYAPTRSVPIPGTSGRAEMDRWALSLSGCFAIIATRANTSAVCLGAGIERILGQAREVSRPESQVLWLLSPIGSLRSATRLSDRWALVLSVTGTARPYHPRFVIDGSKPVYPLPVAGGSLLGGLALAF